MTYRENYLRAIGFNHPEWIPCGIGFSPLAWKVYREDAEKIIRAHPRIFPERKGDSVLYNFFSDTETFPSVGGGRVNFDEMPPVYRQGERFRDNWGCVWYNAQEGLEGQVVEHPLSDWDRFSAYQPPDPLVREERGDGVKDWEKVKKDVSERKKNGFLAVGGGGRLFDRLYLLRGFENLMMDFASDDPHLPGLIKMLEDYEMKLINILFGLGGVDIISFHTDIGAQKALMISPAKFRRYIKPMFQKLFQACRDAGTGVFLSSDGCLLEIVDDLLECGVLVHDPQLRANTLSGIAKAYKGKICANVDLDRQSFPFAKPTELRDQVKEVVDAMADSKGGLMLSAGIYGGDVPLKNVEAICEAMEDYCFYR